jgi:hypothetical protein
MATVISQATPKIRCDCGKERDFTSSIGLPPVGQQSMCVDCGKFWHLLSITTDVMTGIQSWAWMDQAPVPFEFTGTCDRCGELMTDKGMRHWSCHVAELRR